METRRYNIGDLRTRELTVHVGPRDLQPRKVRTSHQREATGVRRKRRTVAPVRREVHLKVTSLVQRPGRQSVDRNLRA